MYGHAHANGSWVARLFKTKRALHVRFHTQLNFAPVVMWQRGSMKKKNARVITQCFWVISGVSISIFSVCGTCIKCFTLGSRIRGKFSAFKGFSRSLTLVMVSWIRDHPNAIARAKFYIREIGRAIVFLNIAPRQSLIPWWAFESERTIKVSCYRRHRSRLRRWSAALTFWRIALRAYIQLCIHDIIVRHYASYIRPEEMPCTGILVN